VIVLKTILKFTLKIAPTRFGAVTPSSGSALFVIAKVTLVQIANYGTSVCVRKWTISEQCNTHTNKDLLIYAATSPPN